MRLYAWHACVQLLTCHWPEGRKPGTVAVFYGPNGVHRTDRFSRLSVGGCQSSAFCAVDAGHVTGRRDVLHPPPPPPPPASIFTVHSLFSRLVGFSFFFPLSLSLSLSLPSRPIDMNVGPRRIWLLFNALNTPACYRSFPNIWRDNVLVFVLQQPKWIDDGKCVYLIG